MGWPIRADGKSDQTVQQRAKANSFENFALSIKDKVESLTIDRMDRNQGIVSKFVNEDDFKYAVFAHLAKRIYEDLNDGE